MLEKGIDTLVLGCTHYPFLQTLITQVTHGSVKILETSIPVTQQLQRILLKNTLLCQGSQGQIQFFSSGSKSKKHQKSMSILCQKEILIKALPAIYS